MKLDINKMVDNFLQWKLPSDFSPDAGISFEPEFNHDYMARQGKPPMKHNPIGTNLFNAGQAKAMIEHMLAGAVSDEDAEPVAYAQENLVDIFKYSKLSVISKLEKGEDDYHYTLPLYLDPPQLAERVKELQDEFENKYNDKCDELDSVNQCFNVAVNKIAELQAELKITDIVQRSKLGKLEAENDKLRGALKNPVQWVVTNKRAFEHTCNSLAEANDLCARTPVLPEPSIVVLCAVPLQQYEALAKGKQ
jgi:hypothetical protein